MRAPASIGIRDASIGDLAAVIALLARQLDEHDVALAPDALERSVRTLLGDPRLGHVLVAGVEGDEIAGVAVLSFLFTLEHGGPAAWLDELYVVDTWRGRGIGERLVEAALGVARARGCVALDLEVEPGHDAATRLYERLGFRRHRRVRWVRPIA
ncbi:GNAT family N-acetyltransferase [Candidatus Binatia bacterium]|jgi:ribosomal protein S18 acetylase RimI-like enzyme|nr:GNAT family N-acetyltransferase [Candidatus Binatia bacterium]